jgi:hypothetical protein
MPLTVEVGGDDSEDNSQGKKYEAHQPHEHLKYVKNKNLKIYLGSGSVAVFVGRIRICK